MCCVPAPSISTLLHLPSVSYSRQNQAELDY
jgi:hypothetical protein